MSKVDPENALIKIKEILGREEGLCGNVYTWGQRQSLYEFVGFELTEDFMPVLEKMSPVQYKNLINIINYFEIHARTLKIILDHRPTSSLYAHYSEIAWSHFMTIVIFGMLEVAVQNSDCKIYKGRFIKKEQSIKSFLSKYLPENTKKSITKRYSIDEKSSYFQKELCFDNVIGHLWNEIRSGFIHEAGFESKGFEWTTFGSGTGTKENPLRLKSDVPIQEWIQLTWQAILNHYGYKGLIEHQKLTVQ